jgi:hypothetical protein
MSVSVAVGETAVISLVFKDTAGNVVPAPTSGVTIGRDQSIATGNLGLIALDPDGSRVHYKATKIGVDTLSASAATPSGTISATETVNVVTTLAGSVAFDETSFVAQDR